MNLGAQLGPMSITKLYPNWACQMGPIHCPKFVLSGFLLDLDLLVSSLPRATVRTLKPKNLKKTLKPKNFLLKPKVFTSPGGNRPHVRSDFLHRFMPE